jgi:HEAT repeats
MFEKDAKIINIEGDDLSAKLAVVNESRAKAKAPQRYWIGYTFPLRANVALDSVRVNANGSQTRLGIITGTGPAGATKRPGLFLKYDDTNVPLNQPARVELRDLDRRNDWKGIPVYWLDRIEAGESLEFVQHLVDESSDTDACACLVEAAAVHNDPGVAALLQKWARHAGFTDGKVAAVKWLGRITGYLEFLFEVATDRSEDRRVRVQSIMSIGKTTDSEAVAVLRKLYDTIPETSLRMYVISALSKQHHRAAAESILDNISESEDDDVLKLHSRAKLDKITGKKKLEKNKAKTPLKKFRKKVAGL